MHTLAKGALALTLIAAAAPALAFHCPSDMKKIDAALEQGTTLDAAALAKVKALRAEGEQLHKSGKHAESVARLGEAMKILGLK